MSSIEFNDLTIRRRKGIQSTGRFLIMSSAAAQKREKKRLENEEKIQNAVQTLRQVSESEITPKNIRREVRQAVTTLADTKSSQGIRAADSIAILESLARDPNIPSSSRVTIWSAISILESVREA